MTMFWVLQQENKEIVSVGRTFVDVICWKENLLLRIPNCTRKIHVLINPIYSVNCIKTIGSGRATRLAAPLSICAH